MTNQWRHLRTWRPILSRIADREAIWPMARCCGVPRDRPSLADQALLEDVLGTRGHAGVRGDGPRPRPRRGSPPNTSTTISFRRINLNAEEHMFLRSRLPAFRRLVQQARQRHQPPRPHGSASACRDSCWWLRQPHRGGRLARHVRDRRRRRRTWRSRWRVSRSGCAMPKIHGACGLSDALRAWVSAKDVDPRTAATARRRRRRRPHLRIFRPRPRRPVGHGPARDRQHGCGDGGDDERLPCRRRGRATFLRAERRREVDCDRALTPRPIARYDEHGRARPRSARAADRPAVEPRQRGARARGRRPRRSSKPTSAPPPIPAIATSRCPPRWCAAARRRTIACRSTSIPRTRQVLEHADRGGHMAHRPHRVRAGASTRPGATAASAWARRRPQVVSACAPCHATFPGDPARARTASISARPETASGLGARRRHHRSTRPSDWPIP